MIALISNSTEPLERVQPRVVLQGESTTPMVTVYAFKL